MIPKQGNWLPYELTPRNVERRFVTCEMLLARHKRKGFLHRIVAGDEKWIHHDNPEKKKILGTSRPCYNINSQAEHLWKKAHVVYLVGSAWCRIL